MIYCLNLINIKNGFLVAAWSDNISPTNSLLDSFLKNEIQIFYWLFFKAYCNETLSLLSLQPIGYNFWSTYVGIRIHRIRIPPEVIYTIKTDLMEF